MSITGRLPHLDSRKLIELDQFLRQHNALPLVTLHGFFTAIISGPVHILPHEWLGAAGIFEIEFASEEQEHFIVQNLMAFYTTIYQQLAQQTYKPLVTLDKLDTLTDTQTLHQATAQWATGYMLGVNFVPDAWFETLTEDDHNLLDSLVFPIMALALTDEALREKDKYLAPNLIRQQVIQRLPELINAIYAFWSVQADQEDDVDEKTLLMPKIGRNDPCPCGSGKKYKKCCLS